LIAELNSLLEAELNYAYFNAKRTAANSNDGSISKARFKGVPYITDSRRPQIEYYNRAVLPADFTSLEDVVEKLSASVQAIELLIPQQTEDNFSCLLNAGFAPASNLCYLVATPCETPIQNFNVVELRSDQRDYFFDLLELSGASFSPEKRIASSRFYCSEEFRCFVAYDSKNEPAGWATMYLDDRSAFLGNAFTLPEHRRRGVHTSLVTARLNIASRLHIAQAFTDVEPASQSHSNCLRSGFRLLSVNNIWKRTHGSE